MRGPPNCALMGMQGFDPMTESSPMSSGDRSASIIRDDVRAMVAYPVANADGLVKMDLMENPFPLPVRLRAELASRLAALEANRYPMPRAESLRATMRAALDIPKHAELILGNGSDELINLVALACARPNAKLLTVVPTFVMYEMSARLFRLNFVGVPLNDDFSLDLEATLASIKIHSPAVIYIAYPNNPTGTLYPRAHIEAIVRAAPGLVVVDEAYQPFALQSFMSELAVYPNLAVMRTVSKSGLAGARLGYMAASAAWIGELEKVRPPFNVNVLTQCYAQFALENRDVLDEQAKTLRLAREDLFRAMQAFDALTVFPSAGNFLLFRILGADKEAATRVFEGIRQQGVLIKDLSHAHPLLANCLRVTVSSSDENASFLRALSAALPCRLAPS